MLPPVPNPEFVSFVKIVIQLSPSLKPKVFAVHTSNFRNLQNNYLNLLYPNFVLIEVKLWSVFMIWWDLFFLGHPVFQLRGNGNVCWCVGLSVIHGVLVYQSQTSNWILMKLACMKDINEPMKMTQGQGHEVKGRGQI